MNRKYVFATNNAHKLREIKAMLPENIEILSLEEINCHVEIPETADTLEGNARIKAHYVYEHYGLDCFADDTGLEVEALNGAPGVHTARYAGDSHDTEANIDKLLAELNGETNRKAKFRTVIALIEKGEEHLFEGILEGEIAKKRCGDNGFGYDPVFIPQGTGKTFAELGPDVKNKISHRALAVAKLVDFISKE